MRPCPDLSRPLSKIRDENVVQALGACLDPQHLCLVLEYCSNGSLYDVISRASSSPQAVARLLGQPFDLSLRASIAGDAIAGMSFLYQRKPKPIQHRDLKSLNVLVDWFFYTLLLSAYADIYIY